MGRIQHIAIASLDPERQAAFYKAVFGFEEVKRIDNPRATATNPIRHAVPMKNPNM